jgi:hypothetical protein
MVQGDFLMPDLILEDVPQELYDALRQAAETNQRSVSAEVLERLRWLQRRRLPDEPFLSGEMSAPCTIPLPGPGTPVLAERVPPRLPDPPWIKAEPE